MYSKIAIDMEIYIKRGEEQFGPFTPEQVEESLQNGSLIESDIAWHEALPDWVPVKDILALKSGSQPVQETAPNISASQPKSGGNKKVVLAVAAGVIVLAEPEGRAQPRPEDQPASPTGTPVGDVFLSFEIGRECDRRLPVQGTVRTTVVVIQPPFIQYGPRLRQSLEQLPVQQLVS